MLHKIKAYFVAASNCSKRTQFKSDRIIFIDKLCIEISNVRPTVSQNITGAAVIPINKKGFTELLDCHVPFAKSNSYKRSLLIERSL